MSPEDAVASVPLAGSRKSPSEYVASMRGKKVIVKLIGGSIFKGYLASLDGYLNIALEQTEEWNSEGTGVIGTFGDALIRGNNVYYISLEE
ncbi:hypothetical protein H696_05552 [Fonticula alba]|uniref:Sm domain-containing protein n=1 Tax=Fonticula alba TaxID=691883 RepID=A0A058Z0N4_FONAL|nr:hypothetical protein H696_05552 [Fonticula alba]KCV67820.1 hypothetical protein H696_05552 [Fonticula alba]|eukprot:XP_009497640.1 hypothetical protein H696_05552 [Fonticula alba]